jgi:hypothetical protein
MRSRCEIKEVPEGVTIRIRPERSVIGGIVWPPMVVLIAIVVIRDSFGWAGLFLWAMMGYLVWRFLWNLFGFEEIVVTQGALTINKRMLLWRTTRHCDGNNVDWIAYHLSAYRSPPGIGVLLKDKVSPFGVAYDIGPDDA